jgi:hypothetical protein
VGQGLPGRDWASFESGVTKDGPFKPLPKIGHVSVTGCAVASPAARHRTSGDQHITMSMNLSGVCVSPLSYVATYTAFGFTGTRRSNTPTVLPGCIGASQVEPT